MAKVSVSIPDELLRRAHSLYGPASTSRLVQRGLRQLTTPRTEPDEPAYAQRPSDADELLEGVRDKLLAEARAEYEEGYRDAMEDIADELGWAFLEEILADGRFDLAAGLRDWRRGLAPGPDDASFTPPTWFGALAKRFGAMIDPIGADEYAFTPTRPYVRGYEAALRDAWATVDPEHPGGAAAPGPEPAE